MARMSFNQDPYYDDFDPKKNYHRILFRPVRPVQTRELNQIQSIFQNQVNQFADNIFKNGSIVANARSSLQAKEFVTFKVNDPTSGLPLNVTQFPAGTVLVGQTSGVTATFVKGVNAGTIDPPTIYVVYTGSGIDLTTHKFIPGENVSFKDANGVTVMVGAIRCPGCAGSSDSLPNLPPMGTGKIFTVDDGIFYYDGMFVNCNRQDLIVSKYGENIAWKIGLDFVQTVVTYEDDPTLLDPTLGYPNSTAPGADRYKADLVLTKRVLDDADGEDFILLCKMLGNGTVTFMLSDSSYSVIMDMLAKRTYETNGNYTVNPYKIKFFESLKDDSSGARGWLDAASGGSADDAVILVSPSVSYVQGYRCENISDSPVLLPKARDVKQIPGYINRFAERTYIYGEPQYTNTTGAGNISIYPNGNLDTSVMGNAVIQIYDGPVVGTAATGTLIGTFQVNDVEYVSGDSSFIPVTPPALGIFKYYIYNLSITAAGKTFADAKSFYCSATNFLANAINDNNPSVNGATGQGNPLVYNTNQTTLLYPLSKTDVKSLRSIANANNGSIDIYVRKKFTTTLDSTGQATFHSSSNEAFDSFGPQMVAWVAKVDGNHAFALNSSNITSPDPSTLVIHTGAGNAGGTLNLICTVIQTNQKEKTKTLTQTSTTTSTAPTNLVGETIMLSTSGPTPIVDAFQILSVQIVDSANPSATPIDDTANWSLNTGQTDLAYTQSSVVRTAPNNQTITTSTFRTIVSFTYFARSGTGGWFDVDSYSGIIADPSSGLTYATIPTYTSPITKQVYPLASTWDFRPDVVTGGTISALPPANGSTAIYDITYYLGRADLLMIDKDGTFFIKMGKPSESPKPPSPDVGAMALYEIWLKPYTYTLDDIKSKFIENKRYTMRDIGHLEERIENLEYYVALNLLEQSAATMQITDGNGLNRFKNGFIADNFSDFQAADLAHPEFQAGLDRDKRQLRPSFKTRNIKLKANQSTSTGVKWYGNTAILPFSENLLQSQPYATKSLSINPYFQYNKKGKMVLSPNNDTWSDDTLLPAVTTTVDTGVAAFTQLASASHVLGTNWGSWTDQNKTIVKSSKVSTTPLSGASLAVSKAAGGPSGVDVSKGGSVTTTVTTTTTTTNQTRTGSNTTVGSRTDSYDLGTSVKDVALEPYMRSTSVQFMASGMKPNTIVYAFFDGIDVNANCRMTNITIDSSTPAGQLSQVAFGSQLITDSNGDINGEFLIPANTFFAGQKTFALTTDRNNTGDPDEELTSASAVFYSGGLDVTKQDETLNVITPTIKTEQLVDNRTVTDVSKTTTSTIRTPPNPITPPPPGPDLSPCPPTRMNNDQVSQLNACVPDKTTAQNNCVARHLQVGSLITTANCSCIHYAAGWFCADPIAQAFLVGADCFVTSLEVFFDVVDPIGGNLFIDIREMVNGYPGPKVYAHQSYTPDQVTPYADSTSAKAFKVTFDFPVYLKGNTAYCFVIGGYSPNTRAWVADLGQSVVNNPEQTVQTPPIGQSSFRSMNGSTWNATQQEYIKFNLYVAQFDSVSMVLNMENDAASAYDAPLDPNPFETASGKTKVRVFMRDHGFVANDKVSFSLVDGVPITISAPTFPPQVGQTLHKTSGSAGTFTAKIASVNAGTVANQYVITLKDSQGFFQTGDGWSVDAGQFKVRDEFALRSIGSMLGTSYTLNQTQGTFVNDLSSARFTANQLAGLSWGVFNNQFSINSVETQDTFIIDIGTAAPNTGRYGGSGLVSYDFNQRYDLFNVSGTYLVYDGTENWVYSGIGHGNVGTTNVPSPFVGDDYQVLPSISFNVSDDNHLNQPMKIASADNETIKLGGRKSVEITATFTGTQAVSPVINTDTFSVTTVANRVEWADTAFWATQDPVMTGALQRFVPETDPIDGTETFKYVTQTVSLANAASDLKIFFDCYKDINADFDVYVKVLPPYTDTVDIDTVPWVLASGALTKVNSADLNDSIEYTITCSTDVDSTYWSSNAPFTRFKVKLVGRSKNSCKPPLFQSFRAIAIT